MYIPLHVHSDASLLDAMSSPTDIANRIIELNLPGCAITDHGSLTNCVKFYKKMKEVGKKYILGIEAYICHDDPIIKDNQNRKLNHQVILAKNLEGWKSLIQLVSLSNSPEYFYYKPRLDLPHLAELCDGNFISFSGHLGSILASTVQYTEYDVKKTAMMAELLRDIFGKDNFYIEIQLIDKNNPECLKVAEILRAVSKQTKISCVATCDAHYCHPSDIYDHRVLLCTNMKTTLAKVASSKDFGFEAFFKSDCFYIPSYEEMRELHKGHEEELQNTLEIMDKCEDYNILSKPQLSKYKCPNGYNEDEYLRQLCREGWKKRGIDDKNQIYIDRIKYELKVLQGAGLSSYFLMVADILNYVRQQGWLSSIGRGSSAGCLVSYLIGITQVDPIKHNLLFERFFNSARGESLPDIDVDIPPSKRDEVIEYIKEKYGYENVVQVATFGTIKGRSALKDVLRAHDVISFSEMNSITEHIPEEAKIADKLRDMKDEIGISSIILWSLKHRKDKLKQWCYLDKEGEYQGPLAKMFGQAIRIEGVMAIQGKHASGVIISPKPLSNLCPMIYDTRSKEQIAGWDMHDLESVGLVKLDILGLSLLDKLDGVRNILRTGDIYEEG